MIPAYREASSQFGTGKNQRQIGIVEGRITDGVLFPSVAVALRERMDARLEKLKAKVTTILAKAVEDVRADLGFVLARAPHGESPAPDDVGSAEKRDRLRETLKTLRVLRDQAEDVRRVSAE
ncbi:hypothetical protein N658DRAFT_26869 [Parathielavia hyrcaniae]|uniref:Uncharacterized protein n=1 Tax=Parathielavia hyrcaniae TaxID=113614 RepID=A0AAN6T7D1_9PEZI|nr:hypothetical protein N658DRAFT_26869 [Parathielavia hyrcaniae]